MTDYSLIYMTSTLSPTKQKIARNLFQRNLSTIKPLLVRVDTEIKSDLWNNLPAVP